MKKENIKIYIAVGVALLLFAPLIFGNRLFPNIFPFTVLQSGIFGGGNINTTNPTTSNPQNTGTINLGDPSQPVTILDLEIGNGATAEPGKIVSVGYIGTRVDPDTGEKITFDQNLSRETPFSFPLGSGQVIPGFDMGVTGMRVGGRRLVTIRPEMGYGNQQAGSIPPNTTLQFMIELYEVKE